MSLGKNKMAYLPVKRLIWVMGLPMIVSMVLQALYNVVDTAFVINMGAEGANANLALTYAFPIQIMIIALSVGTGVGINALLSKCLGEGKKEEASYSAGNGIFLGVCIYVLFLLFGLFGSRWFISLAANGNKEAIDMGTSYLTICCTMSFGAIGFSIYERFLQATGKTMLSMVAQISGALTNIVLDYVFIYPCKMGVEGAAYATVIGQVFSLVLGMLFHYLANKEIDGNIKYIRPKKDIILAIYKIGLPAAIMQALLAVMMLGMNLILSTSAEYGALLQGTYGIYYKIQQMSLFACFGLSNTLISVESFNYGMKDKQRSIQAIKYGIIDTLIVTVIITVLFEALASVVAQLFGLASSGSSEEIVSTCTIAIRIASIGYIFMGVSVAIQGILQALRYSIQPLVISLLRLIVFVLPIAYLFTLTSNPPLYIWWTFPIAELLTSVISLLLLRKDYKEKIETLD